jgi:hypothetical protein
LYNSVVERSPVDRAALLAKADPGIRSEVEAMLGQPDGGALLDQPAGDLLGESSVGPMRMLQFSSTISFQATGKPGRQPRRRRATEVPFA